MDLEVRPASSFADVATLVGPKKPTSTVCFCLSHRIDAKLNRSLGPEERADYVRRLTRRQVKPGVIAYVDDEPVAWAAVAPRAELPFARSTKIPHVDDLDVWSIWCLKVRPGHRKRGYALPTLLGAFDYARACGAPAVEGYPVDNRGEKVDLTMAYVGTRALFEAAGFAKAADTDSVSGGFPRVLMRRSVEGA